MPRKAQSSVKKPKPVRAGMIKKTGKEGAPKALSVPVVGLDGKVKGRVQLPAELFTAKVNKQLLAQAVRVYLANQRQGTASTKTRGEVEGSTRKIYRQKGTGRARHGAIRAPIFVGGGIVFGPKSRDYSLKMPQKMRRRALAAALTSVYQDGHLTVVDELSELEPKTKEMARVLSCVVANFNSRSTLLIVPKNADSVVRAARNIVSVDIMPAQNLNAYAILAHHQTILMKEAIPQLRETFGNKSDTKKA